METQTTTRRLSIREWLFPYAMLIFVPISMALYWLHANPVLTFIVTLLAIIPVTSFIAKSTQELSARTTTVVGSLLNATLGNASEFLIAIFALRAGLVEMVKASLLGSIILNILLLIGISMIAGGIKYREQTFNRDSVGVSSTMLLIAVAGLSMPTIYAALTGRPGVIMSQAVSVILGITYLLSLVFLLFTHRHLFGIKRYTNDQAHWSTKRATLVLLLSITIAGIESDMMVSVLTPTIETTTLNQAFIGLVIIGAITNIPENLAAIRFGLRDNITLSMEIGMNSAIQIALFVAPVLVFVSPLVGAQLSLAFTPFQMAALILTVMIINYLGSDGICNWLEGVQLVSVYIIIAIAFYFI
ncbi:MAG: calcium/proton exchanger [Chloroflexi bacterium]|nr:calcium/proton exchanger [Chloroflexota bacterium]